MLRLVVEGQPLQDREASTPALLRWWACRKPLHFCKYLNLPNESLSFLTTLSKYHRYFKLAGNTAAMSLHNRNDKMNDVEEIDRQVSPIQRFASSARYLLGSYLTGPVASQFLWKNAM